MQSDRSTNNINTGLVAPLPGTQATGVYSQRRVRGRVSLGSREFSAREPVLFSEAWHITLAQVLGPQARIECLVENCDTGMRGPGSSALRQWKGVIS